MSKMIKIDGSLGEGGGQVLRIALSLSALYKIPIEIDNIRAGRSKPGLAAQHLKGVEIARDMCNAIVKGAYIGSTRLEFNPIIDNNNKNIIKKYEFTADTETAGCIGLLAQVALPIALFYSSNNIDNVCPVNLTLKGGSNVPMGPQVEYLTQVFKPWLNKFGADFDLTVLKRGYYPKGGGQVHIKIKPINHLKGINVINCGDIDGISGWAFVAGSIQLNEAYKMADAAKKSLTMQLRDNDIPLPPINIEEYREDRGMAVGNGSGINIVCKTNTGCIYGGSGLGSIKNGGKDPAQEAVEHIMTPIINRSCIDNHMQDQIIILMALAHGYSRVSIGKNKLTQHTETAIKITEIMLKNRGYEFNIKEEYNHDDSDKYFVMECKGVGLENNQ